MDFHFFYFSFFYFNYYYFCFISNHSCLGRLETVCRLKKLLVGSRRNTSSKNVFVTINKDGIKPWDIRYNSQPIGDKDKGKNQIQFIEEERVVQRGTNPDWNNSEKDSKKTSEHHNIL